MMAAEADYELRCLRSARKELAPNGSSKSAPAIMVVGSGTDTKSTLTLSKKGKSPPPLEGGAELQRIVAGGQAHRHRPRTP